MDYKQKYEEALERARKYKEYDFRMMNAALDDIFPELAQSEDEKTRKSLINFLKSPFVNENITDEKVAPWIAWLEKQGQRKTIDEQSEDCDTTNDKGCVACENGELYEGEPNDYTKSNEEKAKEICGKGNPCCNKLCQFCNLSFMIEDVKQMAEWKDHQFKQDLDNAFKSADHVQYTNGYNKAVEKACKWLDKMALSSSFINSFKKEMEEGEE